MYLISTFQSLVMSQCNWYNGSSNGFKLFYNAYFESGKSVDALITYLQADNFISN